MVGELNKEIRTIIEQRVNHHDVDAFLMRKEWEKKQKYEENTLVVDLRSIDTDGSLDQVMKLDKSTQRFVSKVEVISGCLIMKVRREKK